MTTTTTDGIIQLHGNLYRVRIDLINFADSRSDDGSLSFFNPRHVLGVAKPKGFGKEEMSELRESIRTEGLEHPLTLRWIEIGGAKKLQLVGGERRKRCVDKLIKENVDCYDPATESWKPASEQYEYVECRITEMDDQTAYKYAFSENDRSIGIGETATVALIGEFRKAGWIDDQILSATGKSITWLKDTDVLLGLDEATSAALGADEINRSAALKLAEIDNIEERLAVLESARIFAIKRIADVKTKLIEEAASAQSRSELAKAEVIVAKHTGDVDAIKDADERIAKEQKKAEEKISEAEDLADGSPRITSKDVHRAKSQVRNSDDGKALTNSKVKKFWYDAIVAILKTDEIDPDIDLDDARLVKYLLDQRDEGERDIVKILKNHKKSK